MLVRREDHRGHQLEPDLDLCVPREKERVEHSSAVEGMKWKQVEAVDEKK